MKVTRPASAPGPFLPIPAATSTRECHEEIYSYRTVGTGVRDQVEGAGREKEAKGGIRPETQDLHVYLLVAH